MKKSANSIDQSFKDSFQGASEAIDADALWPYVENQLTEEENKGFFLYFVLAIILLLTALAAWFWIPQAQGDVALRTKSHPILSEQNTIQIEKSTVLPSVEKSTLYADSDLSSTLSTPSTQLPAAYQASQEILPAGEVEVVTQSSDLTDYTARSIQIPKGGIPTIPSLLLQNLGQSVPQIELMAGDPKWSRCNDKRSLDIGFLLEGYAFGGVPLLSTSLSNNFDIDYQNFLQSWDQSESAVSTFSGGLLIGLEAKWGGSISTGFEYQQIQNRFHQEQRILERVTIYDEMAYFFIDSNNNRVYVADSVTTTRTYTREIQTAKTHTLINVPVLLGYHRQIGKFRYGLIGGVNFHLRNEFTGKALDASGQVIDAGTDNIYRKDLNVSIIGGLDAGYMVQEGLEIYVSPRFRFQSDSWLNADHPLISKIQLVGLQAGVRLHL